MTSCCARSAEVPNAARSVNCHGRSSAFGPFRRCNRSATQVALLVQKPQSPSKISQGTVRTLTART
jgi:hypothetical protein